MVPGFRDLTSAAMTALRLTLAAGILLAAGSAAAACPDRQAMRSAAEDWLALRPMTGLPGDVSAADAYCGQAAFLARVAESFGPPVGYKVGFTSRPAQQRFGLDGPAAGVLFAPMLLGDGFRLSLGMTRQAMVEADLVVTVADATVNAATTPLEAARSLGLVMPFIEVPDMALGDGQKPNAASFIAYDVLPRFGVLGTGIPVEATPAFIEALGRLAVTATDGDGRVRAEATGAALLGHPLEPLLWLVRHLKAQGGGLRPGDVVSLGSFGAPAPVKPGDRFSVRYEGLARPMTVSVSFTE